MCGADMSLESVSYWGYDGIIHNSHGWGVEHTKCKNWDLVFAITEKHHAESNRTGI